MNQQDQGYFIFRRMGIIHFGNVVRIMLFWLIVIVL